jgi:hypothetical protein
MLYTNRQLFSDHWLRERLHEQPAYQLTPLALARFALWARAFLSALPSDNQPLNTHDTIARSVDPCMAQLGYATDEWVPLKASLWPDQDDVLWQRPAIALAGALDGAPLVVAACAWEAPLDGAHDQQEGGSGASSPRVRETAISTRFLRLLSASDAAWGDRAGDRPGRRRT